MKQIAEWAVLGMAVVAACTAMGERAHEPGRQLWLELPGDGTVHGVGVCGNLHFHRGEYEDLSSRGLILKLVNK